MKAKEIIKLYEDEQRLTSDEIADLINNYFIKKCKSIGMEIEFDISSSPFYASLILTSQVFFGVSQQQRYFKQYIKKVSDVLKKNNIKVNRYQEQLYVYLSHAVSPTWMSEYIFYLTVYLDDFNVIVRISKSRYLNLAEQRHKLSDYEEFSSELKLSEVYRLIDIMVKAIRLTPLEIEAGNES